MTVSTTLCCCLLAVGLSAAVPFGAKSDPPKWPATFTVSGTLSLPYAELNEPFTSYYDAKKNRSRTDFYGGIVQNFLLGNQGKFGSSYKIAFMTNQTHYNFKRCFQLVGNENQTVSPQSILPDLKGFSFVGTTMENGVNTSRWMMKVNNGAKTSKYTMMVNADSGAPIRYEMYGYDSLLGSHFDKYYLDYETYSAAPISDDAFVVPLNDTCGGFPGPGNAETRAHFNPMAEYIAGEDRHHQEMFSKFKKTHNKKYADKKEHSLRESNFRQNNRFIQSKNRSPISYSLAVNHMADMSREELRLMNGKKYSGANNRGEPFNKNNYNLKNLPDTLDWRLFGAVNPVKDQAVCGSCWSFGTTGTLEGSYFLKTGKLLRLSQQELMDCSWGFGNNACDGGEEFRAYEWIMSNGGLATEEDYGSYKAVDFMCQSRNVTPTVKVASYVNVTMYDQEALKVAMFNHGPIAVDIDASHLSLSFYANGVYYEPACGNGPASLDHAVLAVGYGVQHGQAYWLVKNSWSTYWGNDGYVLMSMKENNCGVATSPTFAKIA